MPKIADVTPFKWTTDLSGLAEQQRTAFRDLVEQFMASDPGKVLRKATAKELVDCLLTVRDSATTAIELARANGQLDILSLLGQKDFGFDLGLAEGPAE